MEQTEWNILTARKQNYNYKLKKIKEIFFFFNNMNNKMYSCLR